MGLDLQNLIREFPKLTANTLFNITDLTNSSGHRVYRVSGTLHGKTVRKNFKKRAEAVRIGFKHHVEDKFVRTVKQALAKYLKERMKDHRRGALKDRAPVACLTTLAPCAGYFRILSLVFVWSEGPLSSLSLPFSAWPWVSA